MGEIRKIYFVHFLAGLSTAASVTFTLYFLANGMNQFQIGQLFGLFLILLAILEIPTGGFADTFGHKASVSLGLFCQAISFLFFFLFPNYMGLLFGLTASALGLALQSGATSSLIYEILHKAALHTDFQKIYGRASGYFLLATVIASPIGSFVFKYYPKMPFLFAFLVFLVASLVMYKVRWEFVKKPQSLSTYTNILVSGAKLTLKNRILMALVVIGFALTVNRMLFNQNINQPYLLGIGIDVAYIGSIAAIVSLVLAFVTIYAYKLSAKIGNNLSLVLIVLLPSVAVISLGFINTLFAIPVILILFMSHAFRDPVFTHIIHDTVDPDKRSTMASTMSFVTSIAAGLTLPIFGGRIDRLGLNSTLVLLGAFTLIVGVVGLAIFRSKKEGALA